jgi:hypothetical protein
VVDARRECADQPHDRREFKPAKSKLSNISAVLVLLQKQAAALNL